MQYIVNRVKLQWGDSVHSFQLQVAIPVTALLNQFTLWAHLLSKSLVTESTGKPENSTYRNESCIADEKSETMRLAQQLEADTPAEVDGEAGWISLTQAYKRYMLSKRDILHLPRKAANDPREPLTNLVHRSKVVKVAIKKHGGLQVLAEKLVAKSRKKNTKNNAETDPNGEFDNQSPSIGIDPLEKVVALKEAFRFLYDDKLAAKLGSDDCPTSEKTTGSTIDNIDAIDGANDSSFVIEMQYQYQPSPLEEAFLKNAYKRGGSNTEIRDDTNENGKDGEVTSDTKDGLPHLKSRSCLRVLPVTPITHFVELAPLLFNRCEATEGAPEERNDQAAKLEVSCYHKPIFVAGRYLKLARGVRQSKAKDGFEEATGRSQVSVEELVAEPISSAFGALQFKFVASGREDIDVRMLGTGRPFVVELIRPQTLTALTTNRQVSVAFEEDNRNGASFKRRKITASEEQVNENRGGSKRRLFELQQTINSQTGLVQVYSLRLCSADEFARHKQGMEEGSHSKRYRAVVWLSQPVDVLKDRLCELQQARELPIVQATPMRVLHRRPLMVRHKLLYSIRYTPLNPHFLLLHLETSSGTYIKEFVHGDRGRTVPSLGSLLGCEADILQLDVVGVTVHTENGNTSQF